MSSNILITGANGFLGSHFIEKCLKESEINNIVSIVRDKRRNKWLEDTVEKTTVVEVDLSSCSAIEKIKRLIVEYDIDNIFHFASQAIVKNALLNPYTTYKTNILGSIHLFEAVRTLFKKKTNIFMMSTDKVYGEGLNATLTKGFSSTEPYSTSKICLEYIAEDYRRTYSLNITTIRCCNIYGYDPFNTTRIVPGTIQRILAGEKPTIYNPYSQRQYIYVEDVVEILFSLIDYSPTVFNISSLDVLTPYDVITKIIELMDADIEPITVRSQYNEIESQSIKFESLLPKYHSLEEGLLKTIEKYRRYST